MTNRIYLRVHFQNISHKGLVTTYEKNRIEFILSKDNRTQKTKKIMYKNCFMREKVTYSLICIQAKIEPQRKQNCRTFKSHQTCDYQNYRPLLQNG